MKNVSTLCSAYSEVYEVLNYLGEDYKERIPSKLLYLFEKSKINNYDVNLNNISRNALVIISILNLRYWEKSPDKIEKLKNIYNENEIRFQKRVNQYKEKWNSKNINNSNFIENNNIKNQEEKKYLIVRNESIFSFIKRFIKKLFSKKVIK